jgi:hypothetical protein
VARAVPVGVGDEDVLVLGPLLHRHPVLAQLLPVTVATTQSVLITIDKPSADPAVPCVKYDDSNRQFFQTHFIFLNFYVEVP